MFTSAQTEPSAAFWSQVHAANRRLNMRFRCDFEKPGCWRERASNLAEWEAWDRAWRKKLGWRAGLRFWSKTNVPGSRSLLSRHWPHRLCWSWSIWVGIARPGYDKKCFLFSYSRKYRRLDVRLWWFKLDWSWQDSQWMVGLGPYRKDAPTIYWKHHLEHAVPAGTA